MSRFLRILLAVGALIAYALLSWLNATMPEPLDTYSEPRWPYIQQP